MPRLAHPIAGAIAMLTIAAFWFSTAVTELFGSQAAIVAVKTAIPWGFLLLIPALAATGGSGFGLAKSWPAGAVDAKRRRMKLIAGNGILILVPSALFLAWRAKAGAFDTGFYLVQALELVAGAANLTLLARNMREGFALTGRFRRKTA